VSAIDPTAGTAARVLDLVDERHESMVSALAEFVSLPSISGTDAENDAIAHMARAFVGLGLDVDHWQIPLAETMARPDFPGVEVDRHEAWGVVGRLPGAGTGQGRSLMLNGHVDVVPEGDPTRWTTTAFDPRIEGDRRTGRLFGRGSCDMKAGLVASIWAVDAIRRSGVQLDGDLMIAAVLGEEDGGLGTYATLQRGWRADACVIPEPTSLDMLAANAGALTFRLVVAGQATHAARRTEGVSALEKFFPVHQAILELERERNLSRVGASPKFPILYPISIGTVHCGDWVSSVPDKLVAEGRLGVQLDESPDEARRVFEHAVTEACTTDAWLRDHPVTVEWWGGQFASGRLPDDSDLLDRVQAAHGAITGATAGNWVAPYGSDLRLLTGIGGIPTLQYGPGDAVLAHGPDESVPLAEVHTTARTLALLALDLCGVR